jgi:cation transport regulator ChaC
MVDSMMMDVSTLRTATGDFHESNKLGEGGFGVVYKVPNQKNKQSRCFELLNSRERNTLMNMICAGCPPGRRRDRSEAAVGELDAGRG